jgi:1,2-phenylacetyl-CoA epoxidase catalytic subunit
MAQRFHAPESIEQDSPMTRDGEYRSKLLKLLADQARAELEASNTYSRWIPKAPGPEERMHLAEIAREETEHWYGTIKILEGLGVSVKEANDEWATNHWFYTIVHLLIPRYRWEDILMLTFLMDRCAFLLVEDFAQSSYAPWARFAKQVLEEEQGHVDFGNGFVRSQVEKLGRHKVQRTLNKWWRVALNSFGPPMTKHTEQYIRLGLKYRGNEDRRKAFRQDCERQIQELGLRVPRLYKLTYPFFVLMFLVCL